MTRALLSVLMVAGALTIAWTGVSAQRGGPPGPPLTARQAAPIDLTGSWVVPFTGSIVLLPIGAVLAAGLRPDRPLADAGL